MATDSSITVGRLIRQYRRALGLTQEALAERAQVSAPTISALERGVSQLPHPDTLDRLADALQLSSEERTALRDARRQHLAQAAVPAPAETERPHVVSTNLPPALTSFIGRVREQDTIRQLLQETRLLTLTGAGGCGKTRLALQVAGELLASYPEGVWLVELATVTSPELVPQAVATALGVKEEPGRTILATLIDFLAPRQILLVLDNCEHLVAACAALTSTLLQACMQVRILATSREGLDVAGEMIYLVPSLEVPDLWQVLPLEELLGYAAVSLFVERARARRVDFALSMRNAAAVVQICHRLDGIPLAIELAAARSDTLPVEDIAARLDDCFRLLTSGPRMALPRQKTLRATLDWSFGLLSAQEQTFLPQLSVFAGGWTLEAAEAVGAGEGVAVQEVLDLLAGLVRKSLVLLEDRPIRGGGARYRLLDTVRQYGQEQLLAGGTATRVRQHFRDWCLALAQQAEVGIEGPAQVAWLDRIEAELDNLRSLLAQGVGEVDTTEAALRLATALRWFWPLVARGDEGRWWLEALLATTSAVAADVRAAAIYTSGRLADLMGDYDQAHAYYALCAPMFRELGDTSHLAYALHWLSWHTYRRGDSVRGAVLRKESLQLFRASGDKQGFALVLSVLGNEAHEQSDYPRAMAYWEEAQALFRELNIPWNLAMLLVSLGEVALVRSDLARAQAYYTEGLTLLQELGQPEGIIASHFYLGEVATAVGEFDQAITWFQRGLALCQDMEGVRNNEHTPVGLQGLGNVARLQGDCRQAVAWLEASVAPLREISVSGPGKSYLPRVLTDLGHALRDAGEAERALALYRESLALLGVAGYKPHLIRNLEGLALVAAMQGQPEHAAQLFAAAASARDAIGAPLPPSERVAHERSVAAVCAALGADAFEAAWTAGGAPGLTATVAEMLETGSSGS
jgi:predicted ATPase/DNA-binding XRE family transcriptional regulator